MIGPKRFKLDKYVHIFYNKLWLTTSGVDFIKIFTHNFYTHGSPKCKSQSSCQYLFTLSESTLVKAVRKTLMKLRPDCHASVCNKIFTIFSDLIQSMRSYIFLLFFIVNSVE